MLRLVSSFQGATSAPAMTALTLPPRVEAAARDREAAVARSLVVEALLKQQFSFIFFFFLFH
jgi:hypothetical protein